MGFVDVQAFFIYRVLRYATLYVYLISIENGL